MNPDAPPRRNHAPRRLWIVIALIVVAAVVYIGVIALYSSSGRIASLTSKATPPPPGGVTVILTPDSVNTVTGRISMNVELDASKELRARDDVGLAKTVTVLFAPTAGAQSIEFAAGAVPSIVPTQMIVDGSIENWPFDDYRADEVVVVAYTDDGGDRTLVPALVSMQGYVPGWNITGHTTHDAPGTHVVSGAGEVVHGYTIAVRAVRSGGTIAFGIVLLCLMVAMPCLVLFVAINTYRGRRKMEPTLMSWMAAMLFATIPLRTFLPGSPPIGSWIDYLIVLWVFAGLVAGLVIYVFAWWRWGARGERAP